MNVLYRLMQPDGGEIRIDGPPVSFHSPKDAIAAGIGMVHQHFMLVPVFTVAENVTLGIENGDFSRGGLGGSSPLGADGDYLREDTAAEPPRGIRGTRGGLRGGLGGSSPRGVLPRSGVLDKRRTRRALAELSHR